MGLYDLTPDGLQQQTLDRQQCQLHYWLAGREDAPLLAFLHGAGMDHRMFSDQVRHFAQHYRVLAWDARGHGQSWVQTDSFSLLACTDDLIAILDDLRVEQAVLVGQSMGGMIAQHAYLHHPHRVKAMVMIGAPWIALPFKKWEIWALKASLPLFKLWPFGHFTKVVANNTALQPEVRDYAREVITRMGRDAFLQAWAAITLGVGTDGLPDHYIQVPLLLTHGDQDNTGTVRKQAKLWAQHEPDVRHIIIPHAGHNANQDNSQFFNRVLDEFLAEKLALEGRA